jgi:hypothetical protein
MFVFTKKIVALKYQTSRVLMAKAMKHLANSSFATDESNSYELASGFNPRSSGYTF